MHLTLVPTAAPHPQRDNGFNSRDLIALTCWKQRVDHGYRRVVIEGGSNEGGPEAAGYVLIYAPGSDWASFGLARSEDGIVIWHCGTGADLGRYNTMLQALDSLPPVWSRNTTGRVQPQPTAPRFYLVHSA